MHGARFSSAQNECGKVSTVSPCDNTQNFGQISLTGSLCLKQKEDGKTSHACNEIINHSEA